MKKESWIDDSVVLDFKIPRSIQYLIEKLEEFDAAEDYAYFNYSEALDDGAKELVARGRLTVEQWDLLCAKYCSR